MNKILINEKAPFKSDCSLHLRLALLTPQKPDWPVHNLHQLLYVDNSIKLYKNNNELILLFKNDLSFSLLETTCFLPEIIDDLLKNEFFVVGLYDTFNHNGNMNYHKLHHFNTFLIYGKLKQKYRVYIGQGVSGMHTEILSFEEINSIFVGNISDDLLYEKNINKLGLPLSYVKIKNSSPKLFESKTKDRDYYMFYLSNEISEGVGCIKNFYESFLGLVEGEKNYLIISNINTYYYFVSLLIQKSLFLGNISIIPNLLLIKEKLMYCKNIYSRFIFTKDNKCIIQFNQMLREILHLECCNKKIIEDFYDE